MNLLTMCALQLHSLTQLKHQHIPPMLVHVASAVRKRRHHKRSLSDAAGDSSAGRGKPKQPRFRIRFKSAGHEIHST